MKNILFSNRRFSTKERFTGLEEPTKPLNLFIFYEKTFNIVEEMIPKLYFFS